MAAENAGLDPADLFDAMAAMPGFADILTDQQITGEIVKRMFWATAAL